MVKIIGAKPKKKVPVPVITVALAEDGNVGIQVDNNILADAVVFNTVMSRMYNALANIYKERRSRIEIPTTKDIIKTGKGSKILQ